jgi:FtsP/CotA-like multicopper oxidase with cupredoxin domain
VRRLALLLFVLLVACGSTKLHVVESPSRRLGGTFVVSELAIDPRVTAPTAREDAMLLARELRGALAVVAQDGAGDDNFIVHAILVGYDERMTVLVDIVDRRGARLSRFEVSAAGSARGWTGAARETARTDVVEAIAGFVRSNR